MIHKAFKVRIYPNEEQKVLLAKTFGCVRFVYNKCLEIHKDIYEREKRTLGKYDMCKLLVHELKPTYEWLSEVGHGCLERTIWDLFDGGFKKFFNKQGGFPKFKNKYHKQSFSTRSSNKVDCVKNKLYICNFRKDNALNCVIPKRFTKGLKSGKIKTVTISKNPDQSYYASILVEFDGQHPEKKPIKEKTVIGIDAGLNSFITLSNGKKVQAPKILRNHEKKLAGAQKHLAKKQKGSNNREKQKIRVAKIYSKIARKRFGFLHKLSNKLVCKSHASAICVEDLNVKGMQKNPYLAKSIGDASISEFYRQLEYKCEWYGVSFIKIDRFAPSSKLCHKCGHKKTTLKLSERSWVCPQCGCKHDRDVNAAKNIKLFGLRTLPGIGGDVKPGEIPLVDDRAFCA